MRVVVTGGGGFVGLTVVEALSGRGDDVLASDDFATWLRSNREFHEHEH